MNVPTGQFATNKDIEAIQEHYDRITTYQIPVEQFEKRYYTDMPTEQLATKEEILELEKRLIVLEKDFNKIKNSSSQYWVIPQRSYQIKEDSNSTSTEIAGV